MFWSPIQEKPNLELISETHYFFTHYFCLSTRAWKLEGKNSFVQEVWLAQLFQCKMMNTYSIWCLFASTVKHTPVLSQWDRNVEGAGRSWGKVSGLPPFTSGKPWG